MLCRSHTLALCDTIICRLVLLLRSFLSCRKFGLLAFFHLFVNRGEIGKFREDLGVIDECLWGWLAGGGYLDRLRHREAL